MDLAKNGSGTSGLCPVCAITQENLTQHLETHTKEEIIHSLSLQNSSHDNVRNNQVSETGPDTLPVNNQRPSNANILDYSPISSIQNATTMLGNPALTAASYFSYNPSLSLPTSLLSGVKNNVNGASTSMLPSNIPSVRGSYIQNGPSSNVPQFPPPNIPMLPMYRHPSNVFQSQNESSSTPIVLQNSQFNQNISSYGVDPALASQAVSQTEMILPSTSSQMLGAGSMESGTTSVKINSEAVPLTMNPVQGSNYLSSNVPNNTQGQAVFCLLPYAQIQPSFPSGGNYILCNNGMMPGNNLLPDIFQQQANVNYILGANNSGMPLNNSQFPNQVYYLPSNMAPLGVKQEVQPFLPPQQSLTVRRPMSVESVIVASSPKYSGMATLPTCSTPSNTSHSSNNSGFALENQSNRVKPCQELENTTTIEVGSNIKISLPKDVVEKKDRLKELINRELVRAILINDSEDRSDSDSGVDANNKIGKNCSKNKRRTIIKTSTSNEHQSLTTNDDRKSVNAFTVSCNTNNTGYIDYNSINVNPHSPNSRTIVEGSQFKFDVDSASQELNGNTCEDKNSNDILKSHCNLHTIPQLEMYSKIKTPFKIENDLSLPGISGTKLKNCGNSFASLGFLSPEKNLSFLDVFSDMPYEEEQVLGAVEEVFSSESHIQSNSLECKSSENSPCKEANAFSFDSTNISFESQLTNSLPDDDIQVSCMQDSCSPPKKSLKYAKTYLRVKKSAKAHMKMASSLVSASDNILSASIADSSQINLKIQNISVQTDDEAVDDPLYEELEVNSNTVNESFMNDFSRKFHSPDEDPFSEDSKEGTSIYQGVPLKIENGESNGTLAEEVMSLKASETLADSESERATPSEEMTEIYYGKSCIFAGEPGPPNLSSQGYAHIEGSSGCRDTDQPEDDVPSLSLPSSLRLSNFSVNAVREHGENSNDDTISLTLDASCSILPADTIHMPQLLNQDATKANLLKEETWTKPFAANWLKSQEDSKAFVTTGIIDSYSSSVSPHASTSGLQNFDKGTIKKICREDEEYDFEYESDCYGDSDSDVGHQHRGPLDLEKWRCMKCQKTFKSLKEKLLHSGHHSPCFTGKASSFLDVNGTALEKSSCSSGATKTSKSVTSPGESSESNVTSSSCEKVSKASKTRLLKSKKKTFKKIKVEENMDLASENAEVTTTSTVGPESDFKCTECSLMFPTLDKLYDHRKTILKSRYCCPVCHMEFKNRIGKLRHLKIHPLSQLKCSICHRSFDSFYLWSQHQLFHMGLIFYECKECGHKCQRKGELEIHYRKHSGEKPYSCTTCLSTFVSSHSLKRHLIIHMEGQETECDICHKRYKNSLGLAKHKLKMHSKKKKFLKKRTDFMCETCNEIFHSAKKLAWHRETHERWPKKCQICGECFIHRANLTKHIRLKHDPNYIPTGCDKDSVFCTVCKKTYKRSSIPLHMRTHTGVKPFKCNVCNKEFTVKCNFLAHKWTHTGVRDRPFKCKLCEKSFHLKQFLDMHIRAHKKIRPYTCNECGKSFVHKSNYQTHTRLHTDEKQHECGYCGKSFFRKYNLNNHVRIHTGETPFECTICRKEFTQKSNYNVHMKAFHVERHAIHEEV